MHSKGEAQAKAANKANLPAGSNGNKGITDDGHLYTHDGSAWGSEADLTVGDVYQIGSNYWRYNGTALVDVTANHAENEGSFTDYHLIASDTGTTKADGDAVANGLTSTHDYYDTDAASGKKHPNYMGQWSGLTANTKSAPIQFTCIAYFEGTDPNVQNYASLDTVAANLKFFVKNAETKA